MIDLILVLHCHQPVGNFDDVFERATTQCYSPVLETIKRHPGIKIGLHFSGPLYEWLEKNRSELLNTIGELCQAGQVELLSGGFYEPLLATIPAKDAIGQIEMMNAYLKKTFGQDAKGFWLAERIWDPAIPLLVKGLGLKYTIVDDTHLLYAGKTSEEIYGSFITEKNGNTLTLLPTPIQMRYLIPFRPVAEVIDSLRQLHDKGAQVAIYGDDGEKFGLWPGTYEWVIQKKWLDNFFEAIEASDQWVRTKFPKEYIESSAPKGRAYPPQASYEEMTEWALPSDRGVVLEKIVAKLKESNVWDEWRPFVRGGIWDNFLVKYEESNWMHKKMTWLSNKQHAIDNNANEIKLLWSAQCNCAYWHGVFGGLYLPHLRRAVHENIIRYENEIFGQEFSLVVTDFDSDGLEEIYLSTEELSLFLKPNDGGSMVLLSRLDPPYNLCDTLSRRAETYQNQLINQDVNSYSVADDGIASIHNNVLIKEAGLESFLIFDTYIKKSFLDHFCDSNFMGDEENNFSFNGISDWHTQPYNLSKFANKPGFFSVTLAHEGSVKESLISLQKTIQNKENSCLELSYIIDNKSGNFFNSSFAVEFNFMLYSDRNPNEYFCRLPGKSDNYRLNCAHLFQGQPRIELINRPDALKIILESEGKSDFYLHPLYTVSMSEDGLERTYQGTSIFILKKIALQVGESISFTFRLSLE